ncbi:hypothetical protein [Bryobacter aggregatus]|uniref:hypothetical protein n=1 Tax=Bryobacter aggregatus TaxID=360054 RepID=UPI0004E103A0|nr:hypothetical protein [Bryobacter aggregatus]
MKIYLLATLLLGGCAARHSTKLVPPQTRDALAQWRTAINETLAKEQATDPKLKRDLAISYSEAAVMSRYAAMRQSLSRGRALTAITFETLSLAATTAVPILNGARGKTVIGALATGLSGTRLSIDNNLFRNQTTGAILSAMDTCVSRQRNLLATKRKLPPEEYLIFDAYSDLVSLFACTTIEGAVQELGETQGAAAVAQRKAKP